ncbi:MAG: hypothetical protein M3270_03010, partial [Thermoproteota archaeon]|nr:hypothetical protein [Thermoproteota archaeon]
MSLHSGTRDNNQRHTKAKAAILMAGATVTAAILLSGLSFIGSYQQAIAQQGNMTTGGGGGNATTSGTGG